MEGARKGNRNIGAKKEKEREKQNKISLMAVRAYNFMPIASATVCMSLSPRPLSGRAI